MLGGLIDAQRSVERKCGSEIDPRANGQPVALLLKTRGGGEGEEMRRKEREGTTNSTSGIHSGMA